jgi:hypothetical protein
MQPPAVARGCMESHPDAHTLRNTEVDWSFTAKRQEPTQRHANSGWIWIADADPQFDPLIQRARIGTLKSGAQPRGSERNLLACHIIRQYRRALFKDRDTPGRKARTRWLRPHVSPWPAACRFGMCS